MDLSDLTTESRNTKTMNLDQLSTREVLETMNAEDRKVPLAVEAVLPEIEKVVHQIIISFQKGGRLIYVGAGTSGRLGVLDAAECVPTFGTDPKMVQGLIAGGIGAMTFAVEGAEDSSELGKQDLVDIALTEKDVVVGIAASGRTPYVVGALDHAGQIGAVTAALSCNKSSIIGQHADYAIEVEVGPEILTGSTRLKSGTAQKLVLNMLSTAAMIGIGKVYKNLMVDVQATNEKLVERAKRIIVDATECSYEVAGEKFEEADKNVKLAIIMILTASTKEAAEDRLRLGKGFISRSINS